MVIFIATNVSFLNPYWDGNMRRYGTVWELKNETFKVNSQNIKEAIGIQVTFMFEIKHKKCIFWLIRAMLLAVNMSFLNPC